MLLWLRLPYGSDGSRASRPGARGTDAQASARLGADPLGPQPRLVEPQLPVQLRDGLRCRLQVDDGVDPLGLLVDLVREAAPPPDVDLLHRAARRTDHVFQARVNGRGDVAFVETSVE